jgi:pyrroline-5-carboxylate reductase
VEDESLIDAVTAVSGSGPAYVFHFIECLTDAGVAAGLPPEIAAELAMQTVMGAGALAAESSDTPARLREQVTSPNGTTAAALAVLMRDGAMKKLVGEAVEAARKRSVELGG